MLARAVLGLIEAVPADLKRHGIAAHAVEHLVLVRHLIEVLAPEQLLRRTMLLLRSGEALNKTQTQIFIKTTTDFCGI